MGPSIWLRLILVFFLQFAHSWVPSLSSSALRNHLCPYEQSFALLNFKQTLNTNSFTPMFCDNSYPKTMSWNNTTDCCTWDGITCNEFTGDVTGLDLSCSHLQGNILSNSTLFHLPHLRRLNLASNDFSLSSISHGFGGFSSLTHLNLSHSGFFGQIELEISKLSKLVSVDLSGSLRLRLGRRRFQRLVQNLTQVRELFLADVQINSVLPKNLSSFLTDLDLSSTGLRGNLPDDIFGLPNLRNLELGGNIELTGYLPNNKLNSISRLEVLSLQGTGLSGELPNSISQMKSLRYLDLSQCAFSGPISHFLGNLTQITHLLLQFNYFSGQVPSTLSNLEQLTRLDLSNNNFGGQIPNVFGSLIRLTDIYLGRGNTFTGEFPSSLTNLTQLESLDLSQNSLTGTIPSLLFSFPSLRVLDLHLNRFVGQINEFRCSSLEVIDLSNNELHGSIPQSVSKQVNLTTLYLSSNNLSGDVELGMFSNIKELLFLDLSYNNLSLITSNKVNATLPYSLEAVFLSSCEIKEFDFLRKVENLAQLDLSNNKIHGQIPGWAFYMWSVLTYLNLSNNFLTGINQLPLTSALVIDLRSNLLRGPVPVPPLTTEVFLISHNDLIGNLPSSICNLSSISILDLSHNNLSGVIPQCLGTFSDHLSVLDMRMNGFYGAIPSTFSNGSMLRNLNLNGNQLEGRVPRSLANCRRLEVVDLGNNKINGTFPQWLGTLPELQVLVLKSNRFSGSISSNTSKTKLLFPKLRIIDLSYNEFTGLLPTRYIKSFKAMRNVEENRMKQKYMGNNYYQDSVTVVLKGQQVELVKILTIFTTIDLSSNKFNGEIPNLIGNLNSLRLLNLSHNSLVGQIPTLLGNLSLLESLDLSSNQLEGEIPQQLTDLTFLAFLNLSQNHFVGRIPQGRQFNTFQNDSYSGNLALCGFPLSKNCGENKTPQPPVFQHEDDSYFMGGFTWKVVVMGYGCGTALGLVMGYLMLYTGKPKWFMQIVERELNRAKRHKRN